MNIGGNANTIIVRRRTIGPDGKQKNVVLEQQSEASQLNLNMYLQPETGTITLEEFQTMGMKRLSVLRLVEGLKEKHGSNLDEYREAFRQVNSFALWFVLLLNPFSESAKFDAFGDESLQEFRAQFCEKGGSNFSLYTAIGILSNAGAIRLVHSPRNWTFSTAFPNRNRKESSTIPKCQWNPTKLGYLYLFLHHQKLFLIFYIAWNCRKE